MRLRVALALSLLAARSQPDIDVALRDGRVVVRTVGAPLAEILSRFAQATGAEVAYETARPRQLVSVDIEAASPAEAIAQLLEGQGLDYALRLDPTGRNVEMLVITGSASPAAAPAGTTRAPRASAPPPPEEAYEVPAENAEEPPPPDTAEGPNPEVPAGTSAEEAMSPALAVPFTGAAPSAPSAAGPSGPEMPGAPVPEPGQPQTPSAASYPGGAPVGLPLPSPPVYPGPASYPD